MGVVFNTASINAKVAAWGKSPAGQARIAAVLEGYVLTGKSICTITGNVITKDKMMEAANRMKKILMQLASGMPASVQAHVDSVSIGPIVENGPGSYSVDLSFGGGLSRESLDSGDYPEGVENIVKLFNDVYKANGVVYGDWHGERISSKPVRIGNHFVKRAVGMFNSSCGGVYHATASANGYK